MKILNEADLKDEAEHRQLLYLLKLEEEYYRFHQVRYTEIELLKIFPEVDEALLVQKIKDWENVKQIISTEIRKKLKTFKLIAKNSNDLWFLRQGLKSYEVQKIIEAKKQIYRVMGLLWIKRGKVLKGRLTQEQINYAKQVPIENFYRGKLRRSGKTKVGLCMLHQEKTPSFTIYTSTNTFKCFGCGMQGDVIKLIMLQTGCAFKEAIGQLTGDSNI